MARKKQLIEALHLPNWAAEGATKGVFGVHQYIVLGSFWVVPKPKHNILGIKSPKITLYSGFGAIGRGDASRTRNRRFWRPLLYH